MDWLRHGSLCSQIRSRAIGSNLSLDGLVDVGGDHRPELLQNPSLARWLCKNCSLWRVMIYLFFSPITSEQLNVDAHLKVSPTDPLCEAEIASMARAYSIH